MTMAEYRRVAAERSELLTKVVAAFGLGSLQGSTAIDVGFEDCNVQVRTDAGAFVIKIFEPSRRDVAERTARIVAAASKAGVNHPDLHRTSDGAIIHTSGSVHAAMAMDCVPGPTFFELGAPPTVEDLAAILAQAARVHALDLHPPPVEDPWAIPNLPRLAAHLHPVLGSDDRAAVALAVEAFQAIDRAGLPHRFIHGDLTKGNILRPGPGDVVLIDFGVAHRAPRIQELAVMAANLMHGDPRGLVSRTELLAKLYDDHEPLVPIEREALPAYALAAAAMEFLGALNAQQQGSETAETAYLIDLGRHALHMGAASVARVG